MLGLVLAACSSSPDPSQPYTVSGNVSVLSGEPMADATLSFSGTTDTSTTNAAGDWTSPRLEGERTVTPSKPSYEFYPARRTVGPSTKDADFTGVHDDDKYDVSGLVTDGNGDPMPGVAIRLETAYDVKETSTDADGRWQYAGAFGTVTVRASHPEHYFEPAEITVWTTATDVDFTGIEACSSGSVQSYDDPCAMTTIEQVQGMRGNLAGHYALAGDIDASATSGWNGGEGFAPVGSEDEPFTGTLRGADYVIEHLHIDRPGSSYIGLFGAVGEEAVIRDIRFVGSVVRGRHQVGTLAGSNAGTVENISNAGAVFGLMQVGGIVGWNTGTIEKASNAGDIEAGDIAFTMVGGIAGLNTDGGTISRSHNAGAVTGESLAVGGVVGLNQSGDGQSVKIEQAYNLGPVKGGKGTGGIVGANYAGESTAALVVNSHNSGAVTGDERGTGGIVGENNEFAVVRNTYSVGRVGGDDFEQGGIVGKNIGGPVHSSYFDGSNAHINVYGEPKTEVQLKQRATYVNWDFTDVWSIDEGSGFPDLIDNPRF